jgi:hypothetical protein
MRQIPWKVFLNNRLIDVVEFPSDINEKEVRDTLIKLDGYSANIKVRKG